MQEAIFGKYIKDLRTANNLKQREVEKLCGVSNSYLSQLESGQRSIPSPDILKKLAPVLKISYEELLVVAGYLPSAALLPKPSNAIPIDENTMVTFPVYGRIAAGNPIKAIEEVEEYVSMDTRFFNMDGYTKDDFFFLRINGDSMEPTIGDNDLVLIRRQPTVENNEIAAVICHHEDAAVKRIVASGDKIILSSDNKSFTPIVCNVSDCRIIGKVLKRIGDVK